MKKLIVLILILVITILVIGCGNLKTAKVGEPAPDFGTVNIEGKPVKLSDFAGKWVLLNFWATWCGPCREEIPTLNKIYSSMNQEMEIIAINIAGRDTEEAVKSFVHENNMKFTVIYNTDKKLLKTYAVSGIPKSLLIDTCGEVKKIYTGPIEYDLFYTEMMNILKGPAT